MTAYSVFILVVVAATPPDEAVAILETIQDTLEAMSSIEFDYTATDALSSGDTKSYSGHYAANHKRAMHRIEVPDGTDRIQLAVYYDGTRYALYFPDRRYLQLTTRVESLMLPPAPVPLFLPLWFSADDPDDFFTRVAWPPSLPIMRLSGRAVSIETRSGASPEKPEIEFRLEDPGGEDALADSVAVQFASDCGMWPVYSRWGDEGAEGAVEAIVLDTVTIQTARRAICLPSKVEFRGSADDEEVVGIHMDLDTESIRINHPIQESQLQPPMDEIAYIDDIDTGIVRDIEAEQRFGPRVGWPFVIIGIGGLFVAILALAMRILRQRDASSSLR